MNRNMKKINLYLSRGQNAREFTYSDENIIKMDLQDKKRLHLLKVKVLCEDFLEAIEYEVFIDGTWFVRVSYTKGKGEKYDIKYNNDFMNQYEVED